MITVQFKIPVPSPRNSGGVCYSFDYEDDAPLDLGFYAENYSHCLNRIIFTGNDRLTLLNEFNHIPMNMRSKVAIYRGDFALFIMENW